MPYYVSPKSDEARLTALSAALATSAADRLAGQSYIGQETETALAAFVPQFRTAYEALSSSLSVRSRETRQRREAMAKVEMHVLDIWEGVRRRMRRQDHSVEVLSYYGLPLDGANVKPTTAAGWLSVAGQIIQGDANAAAAGYPPICNPTAAELQTAVTATQAEVTEANMADRAYDEAQAGLAALRAQADSWLEEVMADLRYHIRHVDSASQRRISRTYGATYEYAQGEPRDPDDQEEPLPDGTV